MNPVLKSPLGLSVAPAMLCVKRGGLRKTGVKAALLWVSFGAARPKYRSTCARGCNVQIRFDHGPTGEACQFAQAARLIVAHEPDEVPAALAAMDAARARAIGSRGLPATSWATRRAAPCRGARYARAFGEVHDYIGAGDIYQANLTFPLRLAASGTPQALHAALDRVQPARYGALIEGEGLPAILSRSPELFFRTDAQAGSRRAR